MPRIIILLLFFIIIPFLGYGQGNSVVIVDCGSKSGYGVVYSAPDRIVTALHVVAGCPSIQVRTASGTADAIIEKIYLSSDLALLKLKKTLPGLVALPIYSSSPPTGVKVEYWYVKPGLKIPSPGTSTLLSETSLDKISPLINPHPGLQNSLCKNGEITYPKLSAAVFKFEESNINHNYSGSPVTFRGNIIGLIDGGAKLTDGKPLVWAIHSKDIKNLIDNGVSPPASMSSCASSGASGSNMYSGIRSDNPNLSEEERQAALMFEQEASKPLIIHDNSGDTLLIKKYQRMPYSEFYETLFDESKQRIKDLFSDEISFPEEERLTPDDLMNIVLDMDLGQNTGAWMVYPTGSTFVASKNSMGTVVSINDESGMCSISYYLSKNASSEEANSEMIKFKEMLNAMGQKTEATESNIKDYNCETASPYYRELIQNSDYDEQTDALLSEFTTSITINKSDFLGVWLSVSDWNKMWKDREQRKIYYLLQSAVIFADFAMY